MDPFSTEKKRSKRLSRRFSLPSGLKLSSACETLLQIESTTPRRMSVAHKPPDVRMNRALVIASCMSEAEDFQRNLPHVKYHDVQFIYPGEITSDVMPCDKLLSSCKETIDDEGVDMLVCIHPHLILVYAALLAEYSRFKGPSFESVFLCSHRYYCRRYLTQGLTNCYSTVEMENVTAPQISSVLADFSSPVLLTEVLNCTNLPFCMLVHNPKTVRRELDEIKEKVKDNVKSLTSLITDRIDDDLYDLAKEPVCLVEEVTPHHKTNKIDNEDMGFYIVECCISDVEVIPWVISDINYWTDKPYCKKSVTVPTKIGASTQFEVWAVVREMLEKLIGFGFKDSFVNVTIQINTDGSVRIHDVHPGFVYDNVPLGRFVYQNGDTLKAHCDVSMNQEPHHIKMRPRHLAMKAFITLFSSGSLNELLDVKQFKSNKHTTLTVPESCSIQIIEKRQQSGSTVPGTSRSTRSRLSNMDTFRSMLSTLRSTPGSRRSSESKQLMPDVERSRTHSMDSGHSGASSLNSHEDNKSGQSTPNELNIANAPESESAISRSNTPEAKDAEQNTDGAEKPDHFPFSESVTSRCSIPNVDRSGLSTADTQNSNYLELVPEVPPIPLTPLTPVPQIQLPPDDLDTETEPYRRTSVQSHSGVVSPVDGEGGDGPVITADRDAGVCVGHVNVYGSTAEDCLKQLVHFLHTVVKVKESCPWLTEH